MKRTMIFISCFLICLVGLLAESPRVWSQNYDVTIDQVMKYKAYYDDPRPLIKDFPPKKFLPPEIYNKLVYDVEAMKKTWAEVVGFRSPDVVGKVAPEIQPGVYNYKDKEKYPGLKKLLIPDHYRRFAPGAPPHVGNFPDIKILPTRQIYSALPVGEATKKNEGRTKLDQKGYLVPASYEGGIPFPKPSGSFKAQQIMYNWEKRYSSWESYKMVEIARGFNKHLKEDYLGNLPMTWIRLSSRVAMEPLGFFDKRAETNKETRGDSLVFYSPQDSYGNALATIQYEDIKRYDQYLLYITALRRVRKMTATDTQDALGGQDLIYDDNESFSQKLSPERYPYKYEVTEGEYLMPAYTTEQNLYMSSKGLEIRNMEFERRPMYVVTLTQLDKNYVYGKRVIYIDKEIFRISHIENFDQKGRLYRICEIMPAFYPDMGTYVSANVLNRDFIDPHSGWVYVYQYPTPWVNRADISIDQIAKLK